MNRFDSTDGELSPEETRDLAALREPVAPSAALRDRVMMELRERGALRRTPWQRWRGPLAAAAGIGIAYLAGARSAATPASTDAAAPVGAQYALFLMNAPEPQWPDTTTEAEIVEQFRSWVTPLAQEGRVIVADELAPQFHLVDAAGVRAGDAARGVNGVFIVTAASDSAALALARTLPSVPHGGVVAVQRLMGR